MASKSTNGSKHIVAARGGGATTWPRRWREGPRDYGKCMLPRGYKTEWCPAGRVSCGKALINVDFGAVLCGVHRATIQLYSASDSYLLCGDRYHMLNQCCDYEGVLGKLSFDKRLGTPGLKDYISHNPPLRTKVQEPQKTTPPLSERHAAARPPSAIMLDHYPVW